MRQSQIKKIKESAIPVKFIAKPDEISGLILLLSSNKLSSYITGACIRIDGGITNCRYE